MKASKIKLDYTVNLGNYSNIKLGGEWDLSKKDNLKDCFVAARKELMEAFNAIQEAKKNEKQAAQADS